MFPTPNCQGAATERANHAAVAQFQAKRRPERRVCVVRAQQFHGGGEKEGGFSNRVSLCNICRGSVLRVRGFDHAFVSVEDYDVA